MDLSASIFIQTYYVVCIINVGHDIGILLHTTQLLLVNTLQFVIIKWNKNEKLHAYLIKYNYTQRFTISLYYKLYIIIMIKIITLIKFLIQTTIHP